MAEAKGVSCWMGDLLGRLVAAGSAIGEPVGGDLPSGSNAPNAPAQQWGRCAAGDFVFPMRRSSPWPLKGPMTRFAHSWGGSLVS